MISRCFTVCILCAMLALAACHGGGGSGTPEVTAININPATPVAGSLVQLSGTITGGSGSITKNWSVSAGSLSATPPDFALILRSTARGVSATTLDTTANTVYWLAPVSGSSATITLTVQGSTKQLTVPLSSSPVSLAVVDGNNGTKQVSVNVSNITDLYQAAFRVTFTSAWTPTSVSQGDFLGDPADTLFLGLDNQNDFVPVAVSRKGNAGGVDGSGTLATITFTPSHAGSARSGSEVPFDLSLVVLRNSHDAPISF